MICACLLALLIATLPSDSLRVLAATGWGSVGGRVSTGSKLSSRRTRFRIYPDFNPVDARPAETADRAEVENVVVYLEGSPATPLPASTPPGRLAIEQRDETFVPHVLPVLRGSVVEFPNQDPIFHNVFSLSKAQSFDLGRYPRPTSKAVRFDQPGIVKVFCHIHSDMSAVVVVLENPFFASPGADGRYRIDGIPPGEYILVAWHERAKPVRRPLAVCAGCTAAIDFDVPVEELTDGR